MADGHVRTRRADHRLDSLHVDVMAYVLGRSLAMFMGCVAGVLAGMVMRQHAGLGVVIVIVLLDCVRVVRRERQDDE